MLLNYLIPFLLLVLKLSSSEHHRKGNIVSISSILGTRLVLNAEILNEITNVEDAEEIVWYKGNFGLKPLISTSASLINRHNVFADFIVPTTSRYHIVNRTKLIIEQTSIGDEGFYTLNIQNKSNKYNQYLYHVILFTQNLSLSVSSPPYQQIAYYADQQVNFTCSISFFADRTYIEGSRLLFLSIWHMIIYNTDPDDYQLLTSSSSSSYTYTTYLFNYELNRNDHNQTISCALIEQDSQQTVLINVTLSDILNIEYKAYLQGNYYFTRSFNAHSSIEINCEEFAANPKPLYTLIWILNEENKTILNKTNHGRYFIDNATWQHRGNYTCFAENYHNKHQPAHQSFRLNIWFNEHQSTFPHRIQPLELQQLSQSPSYKWIILIFLSLIFLFACLFFILSLYCFCLQFNSRTK